MILLLALLGKGEKTEKITNISLALHIVHPIDILESIFYEAIVVESDSQ